MAHLDTPHGQLILLDGIDEAVPSLADPIKLCIGELFTPFETWVLSESLDPVDDSSQVASGALLEILPHRSLVKNNF